MQSLGWGRRRVIDEDVYRPELGDRDRHHRLDLGSNRYVAFHCQGPPAQAEYLCGRTRYLRKCPASNSHRGALLGERECDALTAALTRAGDYGDLAVQRSGESRAGHD